MPSPILPKWFKVGAECLFRGFGSIHTVVSIDEAEGSWIAETFGDPVKYPLDEVEDNWQPVTTEPVIDPVIYR